MQAGLAMVSALLGLWAWLDLGEPLLLAGSLLILAVVPFTLVVILPTNKLLLDAQPGRAGPEIRAMLVKWGRLHWVRNLLGLASVAAFALALAA